MDRIGANNTTYNLLSDILKIAGEYHPLEIKNASNHVKQTSKGDYHDIMIRLLKDFEILNNLPETLSFQPENALAESDNTSDKSSKKGDGSSSSDKTKAAQGKTKAVQGKTKAVQGKTKAVQGKTKAVQGKTKAVQGKTKAVQSKTKAVQGKTKAVQGKTKAVQGKIKSVPKEDPKINQLRAMLEDNDFINSKKDIAKLIDDYFKGMVTSRSDNKDSKRDLIAKIISVHKNMESAQKQKIYSALRRSYLKKRKTSV